MPSDSLAAVADWAVEHLREDLGIERLAARALMSPRTFARRFKAEYGATPAAWLGRQRVLHAQRMLERSALSLDRIGGGVRIRSAGCCDRTSRVLGTTPTAYRARFSCADETEFSAA